ncbi:MAG: hypothetical protein EPN94_12755 [Nitrospirae bacterium]|nr:MAG: hypothetical protein EPN94_12755 [Nitrospirota bacterium]
MSAPLRKFILLLLIACLPLQGLAMGVKALAHKQAGYAMTMPMDGDMTGHDMAGHDMASHDMASHDCCHHDDASPAHPMNSCGDGAHCSLCNISVTSSVILPLLATGAAALYPAPPLSVSRFYPEQPQRPPLARNA